MKVKPPEFDYQTHNQYILGLLTTCPVPTQMSQSLLDKCNEKLQEMKDGKLTAEVLRDFLGEIYNSCHETSSFVKEMVNPKFTASDAYTGIKNERN